MVPVTGSQDREHLISTRGPQQHVTRCTSANGSYHIYCFTPAKAVLVDIDATTPPMVPSNGDTAVPRLIRAAHAAECKAVLHSI